MHARALHSRMRHLQRTSRAPLAGSLDKDEVFVPEHQEEPSNDWSIEQARAGGLQAQGPCRRAAAVPPLAATVTATRRCAPRLQTFVFRLGKLLSSLLLGWPLYLFFNVASRPYPEKLWVRG